MGATAEADDSEAPEDEAASSDPRGTRPTIHGRPDFEMNVIGWGIFIILIVLMIPMLPGLILAITVAKLLGFGGDRRVSWGQARTIG